jgi:hypothetical protein
MKSRRRNRDVEKDIRDAYSAQLNYYAIIHFMIILVVGSTVYRSNGLVIAAVICVVWGAISAIHMFYCLNLRYCSGYSVEILPTTKVNFFRKTVRDALGRKISNYNVHAKEIKTTGVVFCTKNKKYSYTADSCTKFEKFIIYSKAYMEYRRKEIVYNTLNVGYFILAFYCLAAIINFSSSLDFLIKVAIIFICLLSIILVLYVYFYKKSLLGEIRITFEERKGDKINAKIELDNLNKSSIISNIVVSQDISFSINNGIVDIKYLNLFSIRDLEGKTLFINTKDI